MIEEERQDRLALGRERLVALRAANGGIVRAEQARQAHSRLNRRGTPPVTVVMDVGAAEERIGEILANKKSWQSGYGMKGGLGPNTGKKAVKFTCQHPLRGQPPKTKRVFDSDAAAWAHPVALWYKAKGVWHLNTVVDGDNVPNWASDYIIMPARRA